LINRNFWPAVSQRISSNSYRRPYAWGVTAIWRPMIPSSVNPAWASWNPDVPDWGPFVPFAGVMILSAKNAAFVTPILLSGYIIGEDMTENW
jgi:hypothetical protein